MLKDASQTSRLMPSKHSGAMLPFDNSANSELTHTPEERLRTLDQPNARGDPSEVLEGYCLRRAPFAQERNSYVNFRNSLVSSNISSSRSIRPLVWDQFNVCTDETIVSNNSIVVVALSQAEGTTIRLLRQTVAI